jgi:hypothetical protein
MSGVAREIKSWDEFIAVCNARVNELQLTRAELDEICGFPENYSSKLLRNRDCSDKRNVRSIGRVSYPKIFGALGLRLFLLQDDAATAKTLALRTPRKACHDTSAVRKQAGSRADSAGSSPGLPAAALNA